MKIASRLIDLISTKKTNCTCSTLFCLSLAVVLHDYNAALFCTTKTSNVLVTHYFLWRNCRMCLPNILFPVFMFAFIFHCRSFSPCWPLAFLIFSSPLWISMFFFLRNSSPLFSVNRSSSFSVIHVSVNIKNNAEKGTTLLLFFLLNKTLSRIWFAIPVDWVILHWYACGADGRSLDRSLARCTVTWLPNFLGWVDYHISLAMALRPRAALRAARGAPL